MEDTDNKLNLTIKPAHWAIIPDDDGNVHLHAYVTIENSQGVVARVEVVEPVQDIEPGDIDKIGNVDKIGDDED